MLFKITFTLFIAGLLSAFLIPVAASASDKHSDRNSGIFVILWLGCWILVPVLLIIGIWL